MRSSMWVVRLRARAARAHALGRGRVPRGQAGGGGPQGVLQGPSRSQHARSDAESAAATARRNQRGGVTTFL